MDRQDFNLKFVKFIERVRNQKDGDQSISCTDDYRLISFSNDEIAEVVLLECVGKWVRLAVFQAFESCTLFALNNSCNQNRVPGAYGIEYVLRAAWHLQDNPSRFPQHLGSLGFRPYRPWLVALSYYPYILPSMFCYIMRQCSPHPRPCPMQQYALIGLCHI